MVYGSFMSMAFTPCQTLSNRVHRSDPRVHCQGSGGLLTDLSIGSAKPQGLADLEPNEHVITRVRVGEHVFP